MKVITFRIDESQLKKLKELAQRQERTLGALIRKAIDEYLK